MSNEQEHIEEHSSPIKTPKQLVVTIVLSFVIPIAIIILLVNMVVSGNKTGAGSDTLTPEAVTKRIAPVAGFELVDANAPQSSRRANRSLPPSVRPVTPPVWPAHPRWATTRPGRRSSRPATTPC